jgi:hypothetical protein
LIDISNGFLEEEIRVFHRGMQPIHPIRSLVKKREGFYEHFSMITTKYEQAQNHNVVIQPYITLDRYGGNTVSMEKGIC